MRGEEMQPIRYRPFYLLLSVMIVIYLMWCCCYFRLGSVTPKTHDNYKSCLATDINHILKQNQCKYNPVYPLTHPRKIEGVERFRIAIIADLDKERSRVPEKSFLWKSFLRTGYLTKYKNGRFRVEWINTVTLTSSLNENGRGLELSELCVFNGKLYTVDDRTGVVYQIKDNRVIPWVILMDGDGSSKKGFKSEWMTVKDGALYVGGLGKEWTTKSGTFINYHPLFVKSIDQFGAVMHHNWTLHYLDIRAKVGIHFPGYMIHEAVTWSNIKARWYFLPRRMSKQKYDDMVDERRGTNVLISCSADFTDIKVVYIGRLDPTHGFSSFKFVPGTRDSIAIALKTKEVGDDISSYIIAFNVDSGKILMPEEYVASNKYEGIEFV